MMTCRSRSALALVAGLLLAAMPAQALILVRLGNGPVPDRNWRAGAVDVANLRSRVCMWEGPPFGGGQYNFLYRGDTDAFNAALKLFAKVRAPSLELIVRDGPAESPFLKNDKDPTSNTRYDWDFVIWDVQSYYRLYGNPTSAFMSDAPDFRRPLPAPRMTVFVGGGGAVVWDKVHVPEGITVIDRRASAAGIKPGQGAVIAGNVFDMATSKPLAGAAITVEQAVPNHAYKTIATARTDAEGRFRMEKVPAGAYRVTAAAEGYAPLVAGYKRVVKNGYLPFDDIELAPAATVTGRVVDHAGKPIAGASVHLSNTMGINGVGYRLVESAQTAADAQGRFHLSGVPAGYGRIVCFAAGYYAPLHKALPVPAKDLVVRMTRTGTIKGKVIRKGPKGRAVHVSVAPEGGQRIGKWSGSMLVNPDGTFQFRNVPPGTYVISTGPVPLISGQAHGANARKITVVADHTVTVELKQ